MMFMVIKDKMVLIMFMMADLHDLMLSQVWAIYIVQAEEKVANTEHVAEDDDDDYCQNCAVRDNFLWSINQ